jgi:hypothetical protein
MREGDYQNKRVVFSWQFNKKKEMISYNIDLQNGFGKV